MSPPVIDVVVPVYAEVELTRACLESVLEHSGPRLGRLIVVDDRGPDAGMTGMLEALRLREGAVRLLVNERNLGFVASCNRGLGLCPGDVVVLNSDTRVTPGWLDELAAVLESDDRIAAVSPLSNNATLCSIPRWGEGVPVAALEGRSLSTDEVERFTEMPTLVGFCMLLRGSALRTLGGFDPAYGRGYNEENDWCQRARAAGFMVVRANRALVFHLGEASFQGARERLDRHNLHRLVARYPSYLEDNAAFARSLGAHAPALAHRAAHDGVRVQVEQARFERSDGPSLTRALSEQLAAAEGVVLVEEAPDVVVVAGFPTASRLRELLATPVHLVHAPCELEPVEQRPGLASRLEGARAIAFALWSSGGVVLPDAEALEEAQRLFGGPLPAAWVSPWPLPVPIEGPRGDDLLVSSRRVTGAELGALLAAWARVPRDGARLRLAVPLDRVPDGWGPRLDELGVSLESPRPLERLAHEVRGLLVPASERAWGLEARAARQAGVPVVRLEEGPAAALAQLLSSRVPEQTRAAPRGEASWHAQLAALCAQGGSRFAARSRLVELLDVTRASSS